MTPASSLTQHEKVEGVDMQSTSLPGSLYHSSDMGCIWSRGAHATELHHLSTRRMYQAQMDDCSHIISQMPQGCAGKEG